MSQKYGLDEQIRCVDRELSMRKKVYTRQVEAGRMSEETMAREMGLMHAVRDTLLKVQKKERLL